MKSCFFVFVVTIDDDLVSLNNTVVLFASIFIHDKFIVAHELCDEEI